MFPCFIWNKISEDNKEVFNLIISRFEAFFTSCSSSPLVEGLSMEIVTFYCKLIVKLNSLRDINISVLSQIVRRLVGPYLKT